MKNGQARSKNKTVLPAWEQELLKAEKAGAKGVRVIPPLVTYETDYEYGTKTKLVNGHAISFVKMPDTKPIKPKRKSIDEEDED